MTYFTIELQNPSSPVVYCHISNEYTQKMFSGRTFDEFQDGLIKIVNSEKAHATIRNRQGNEIMSMRYSPNCKEGVCCGWSNQKRLNNFIKGFNA